jgi:hypothetical protein
MHTKSSNHWRSNLAKILNKEYFVSEIIHYDLIATMIFRFPSYKFDKETNEYHLRTICRKNKITYMDSFRFVPGTIFMCSKKLINEINKLNINDIYNDLNDDTTKDENWIKMMNNNNIFKHHVQFNKIDIDSQKYIHLGNNFALMKVNKSGIRDGMKEHAWERIFGLIAENLGGNIKIN